MKLEEWWSNTNDILFYFPVLNEEIVIGSMVLGARKYADRIEQRVLNRVTNFAGSHVSTPFNRGE